MNDLNDVCGLVGHIAHWQLGIFKIITHRLSILFFEDKFKSFQVFEKIQIMAVKRFEVIYYEYTMNMVTAVHIVPQS